MILAATKALLAVAMSSVPQVPAASQDPDATPVYGVEAVTSPLDETIEVRVQAGGPITVRDELPPPCRGYIGSAPDFDLNYEAGDQTLFIYVESDSDTTLAIQAPGETWHCGDDERGLNPSVVIGEPSSGLYSIWVGTYRDGGAARAMLYVSETAPSDR